MSNVSKPRKAGRNWTGLIAYVKAIHGHMCYQCGRIDRPQVDHIHPWQSYPGSEYDAWNLGVMCHPCNKSKGKHAFPPAVEDRYLKDAQRKWAAAGIDPHFIEMKGGRVYYRGDLVADYSQK